MKNVTLGGARIPSLGLGFWQIGGAAWGTKGEKALKAAIQVLEAAAEHGIQLVDTAEVYGLGESERILGEALKKVRGDFIVASKVAGYRWRREDVLKAAERSRARIGRLDLVQHHWPPPVYARICSVVRGLEDAVQKGIAGMYGLSNYPARLLERVYECSHRIEPVSNQIQYSLAFRQPEALLIPFMARNNMTLIAWSPLAKGALAGATRPRSRAQKMDPVFMRAARDSRLQQALARVAGRHGTSKAVVALAWIMAKGGVPIPGTRSGQRVREYAMALRLTLDEEDMRILDDASARYINQGDYRPLQKLRLLPGVLQDFFIRAFGGV
ncbi:MAG: aldo/keto reductase [Desulfurococcales archaeon]|nr:aldo/keto reductase [Desulfurococcales archaeon]